MYLINVSPMKYADPWVSSFQERLKMLGKGNRRVAYYYENPDNSTFRYRVYNMIQVLREKGNDVSAAYFTYNELNDLEKVVDVADVLVVCRSRYNDKLDRVITKARNRGKPVFYDIDDRVFDTAYVHLILDTLNQDLNHPNIWDFWFAYTSRLGLALTLCDKVITTNEYLAARIQEFSHKPVSVIPNFLNKEQMEISDRIYQYKKSRRFKRNGQIHLGYFSGTPSHNKDFQVISDTLERLIEINPRIVIRVVGYLELRGTIQNHKSRLEFLPLHDFVNLQRLVGEVEVNLVPIQDNEFTNCKSELKYFEAGIVGTVTVASPIFTYARAIRDKENGFLARSYEWYDKLSTLVTEIESLPTVAEKARIESEQKYAWYNQIGLIERTLFPVQ
jgi:glycosyltransferase involved in cell wall biosynthesis